MSVDDLVRSFNDPPETRGQVEQLFDSGRSRLDWTFILEEEGGPIGRVAYRVEATAGKDRLGSLPPFELYAFGWSQPFDNGALHLATQLLAESLGRIAHEVPERLDVRLNAERHDHVVKRVAIVEALGFEEFQEKQGFTWVAGTQAPPQPSPRLLFRPLSEIGRDAYAAVLAGTASGTLDRNDRYYQDRMATMDWATEMMGYLDEADVGMWLAAYDDSGAAVGFVAVSGFGEPQTATITHVGVLPAYRGRGYVNDLIAAATRAAYESGYGQVLSDVDVENGPMIAAMRRANHRDGVRPWHVWHYRANVAGLVALGTGEGRATGRRGAS